MMFAQPYDWAPIVFISHSELQRYIKKVSLSQLAFVYSCNHVFPSEHQIPYRLYSTLLYSTLLYSTLLYSTLLYSTLLYSIYTDSNGHQYQTRPLNKKNFSTIIFRQWSSPPGPECRTLWKSVSNNVCLDSDRVHNLLTQMFFPNRAMLGFIRVFSWKLHFVLLFFILFMT